MICTCNNCGHVFWQQDNRTNGNTKFRLKKAFTIIDIVAQEYEVTEKQILSRCRKKHISAARHLIMFFIYKYCNYSYSTVAKFLHRKDHSTIMYGVERVNNALSTKEDVYEAVMKLDPIVEALFEDSPVSINQLQKAG